jgi:hypothetical protein
VACSTCQCVLLEVRVVSGVQHMSVCDIRGESCQWREAPLCVILEWRVVSGVQHMSMCVIRGESCQWRAAHVSLSY